MKAFPRKAFKSFFKTPMDLTQTLVQNEGASFLTWVTKNVWF